MFLDVTEQVGLLLDMCVCCFITCVIMDPLSLIYKTNLPTGTHKSPEPESLERDSNANQKCSFFLGFSDTMNLLLCKMVHS